METAKINGKTYCIEYKETKIGDRIYNKNNKGTYIADIADADDLNWIVGNEASETETIYASKIKAVHSNFENASIQIGDEWYYISYTDLAKILQKSRAKLKIEKKRVRTWAIPI